MWENYKQICFIAPSAPPEWDYYAIITAWNPGSLPLSREQNEGRHRSLRERVCHFPSQEVWGSAPDRSWQEFSLAVACSLPFALSLAEEFEQNALYWVEKGELFLLPVRLRHEGESLGRIARCWIADATQR